MGDKKKQRNWREGKGRTEIKGKEKLGGEKKGGKGRAQEGRDIDEIRPN